MITVPIVELLHNYGRTSTKEAKQLLERIEQVMLTHKGVNTTYGYYTFNERIRGRIKTEPRGFSAAFDVCRPHRLVEVEPKAMVQVYVKSTSRFMCKPDIAEVFDQMTDLQKQFTKAIYIDNHTAIAIEGQDDHFIVTAHLLW